MLNSGVSMDLKIAFIDLNDWQGPAVVSVGEVAQNQHLQWHQGCVSLQFFEFSYTHI